MNKERQKKKSWTKPTIQKLKFNQTREGAYTAFGEGSAYLPGS